MAEEQRARPDWSALASLRSNPHVIDVSTTPLLSSDECTEIGDGLGDDGWDVMRVWAPTSSATEAHRGAVARGVRRGRMRTVPGGNHGPLAVRIAARVMEINDEVYRFRVVGVEESVQVLWYAGEDADRYVLHKDLGPATSMRKLSFSLLLSDPDAYEGGDLCFGTEPFLLARVQGTLTVFPSFLDHSVTPVTAGDRLAVVGFVLGPTFA